MNINNLYRGTLKIKCIDKIIVKDYVTEDISINKNGIEVLVYKLLDGDYFDLKTKKIYKKEDIVNLVELSKIINVRYNLGRKKIIKLYKKNLISEFNLDNLFIGDLAFIYKFDKKVIENKTIYIPEVTIIEYDKLLLKKELEYLDLESYNCYNEEQKLGKTIVVNIRTFKEKEKSNNKKIKKFQALNDFRKKSYRKR